MNTRSDKITTTLTNLRLIAILNAIHSHVIVIEKKIQGVPSGASGLKKIRKNEVLASSVSQLYLFAKQFSRVMSKRMVFIKILCAFNDFCALCVEKIMGEFVVF
jgi:hypothetical protein